MLFKILSSSILFWRYKQESEVGSKAYRETALISRSAHRPEVGADGIVARLTTILWPVE